MSSLTLATVLVALVLGVVVAAYVVGRTTEGEDSDPPDSTPPDPDLPKDPNVDPDAQPTGGDGAVDGEYWRQQHRDGAGGADK